LPAHPHQAGGAAANLRGRAGLEFCDSAGIACLVVAWKVARTRGGSLVLLRPRARLGRKLAVIGLAAMLTVVEELPLPYDARSPEYVG